MATSSFFQLLLVLATCSAAVATNESPMPPKPAPGPSSSAATSFLHACCAPVRHADACYNLLLPYADSFHGSLARVTRTSAGLAITRQHGLTEDLARLKQHGTGAGRMADMVLADCFNTVATAEVFANETLGQLDDLVAGVKSKKDLETEKFFAQVWIGSAASSMSDCMDWVHDDPAMSSPVLKEVTTLCASAKPYMDIALDLIDAIKFESVIYDRHNK
ncbi:hypothetical protein EJB05_05520, partial [Eragrostis curvula]